MKADAFFYHAEFKVSREHVWTDSQIDIDPPVAQWINFALYNPDL
jgi:hypothetical protein